MGILTLKDGKQYREQCPACGGIHIYELKERNGGSNMERYACPDCEEKFVAPTLLSLESVQEG